MKEQYAVDQGQGKWAGSASQAYYGADEAVPASAVAQVLRHGPEDEDDDEDDDTIDHTQAALPHDKVVPVQAFIDDVKRKVALRKVMFDMKNPKKKNQEEALVTDDQLLQGQQWDKDDKQVNYRYSGNPSKSCGVCKHFIAPGECEIVAGLIRPVDLCDQFKPLEDAMNRPGVRPSTLVTPEYIGEVARVIRGKMREQADELFFGDDATAGDCSDDEKDMQGRCPDDPDFDFTTAGLYDPSMAEEADPFSAPVTAEFAPKAGGHAGGGGGQSWSKPDAGKQGKGFRGKGGRTGGFGGQGVGGGASRFGSAKKGMASVHGKAEAEGGPGSARPAGMKTHLQVPGGGYGMKTAPDFVKLWSLAQKDPAFKKFANAEVSPPGWSGTVKAMKRHKSITNPWALAWYMKGKGAQPHYPPEKTAEVLVVVDFSPRRFEEMVQGRLRKLAGIDGR